MVHAKDRWRRVARETVRLEPPRTTSPGVSRKKAADLAARQRAGLTADEARLRFRLRTLAECCAYVACWLLLIVVSLPVDRQAIDMAEVPRTTATVVTDYSVPSGMSFEFTSPVPDPEHVDLPVTVAISDPSDYTVGQKVQLLGPPCDWEPASGFDDGLTVMAFYIGVIPAGGLAFLVFFRAWRWRQLLLATGYVVHRGDFTVSLYHASWRTFIAVDNTYRTFYVPVMRNQGLEELTDMTSVQPLVWPDSGTHVLFRVAGTDRVVWPIGGSHTAVWPVGRMALTIGRVVVPLLLVPLLHWVHTSLPLC